MLKPLTKADAVGLSRMPISSAENGKRGITSVRSGTNNMMMMGNPTAAVDDIQTTEHDESIDSSSLPMISIRQKTERERTDRLRDRKGRAERDQLYRNKEKDARFAHAPEWLVVWRHRAVREEVNDLLGNAVS
jgi:hypothetical protein